MKQNSYRTLSAEQVQIHKLELFAANADSHLPTDPRTQPAIIPNEVMNKGWPINRRMPKWSLVTTDNISLIHICPQIPEHNLQSFRMR